eukprot:3826233-Prymnesium_polylepis.1
MRKAQDPARRAGSRGGVSHRLRAVRRGTLNDCVGERQSWRKRCHPAPDVDAIVVRARHDPCAVGREAHGIHQAAVGAQLLRHQRQR